jgi:hypothetical protein
MQPRVFVSCLTRSAGVALLLAAVGAGPASAAPTDGIEVQQPVPPAGPDQGALQTLIGVRPVPAAPPGGPPPGGLPPVPDRFAEPIGPFAMHMEVLASAGPSQAGLIASPGCATDSVYKRGMKLVFRFEVYDMDNKVRVTSADGSTAEVQLPDGTTLPAVFLPRAGPGDDPSKAPWTWVTVWQIPTDYPLGPVVYSVAVATPDGRADSLTPPSIVGQPVQAGVPLAVAGTFPTIIP